MLKVYLFFVLLFFSKLAFSDEYDPIYKFLENKEWEKLDKYFGKFSEDDIHANLLRSIVYDSENYPGYDRDKATYYLEKASTLGSFQAKILLVARYMLFADPQLLNFERGRYWAKIILPELIQGSKKSDPESLRHLAMFNIYGLVVEKNTIKAFELYKRAADLGDLESKEKIAFLYSVGLGVNKDLTKAKEIQSQIEKVVKTQRADM